MIFLSRGLSASLQFLSILITLFGCLTLVSAQCVGPLGQGESTAWPKNATVAVNISPTFTTSPDPDQRAALRTAFTNWSNVVNSGVTFTFTYNSSPQYGDANTMQVSPVTPTCPNGGTCQASTSGQSLNGRRMWALVTISPNVTNLTALTQAMSHELGHTFGLADCGSCADGTSAMTLAGSLNDTTKGRPDPSACDKTGAYPYYNTTTVASNTPGGCNGLLDYETYPSSGCASGFVATGDICQRSTAFQNQCFRNSEYDDVSCACTGSCQGGSCSPVVVDVLGDGFLLTNAANGVNFDLDGDGIPERRSWTAANADEAWLVLDRNGDGTIDNGKEMFGNASPQLPLEPGEEMNGFRALALYGGFGYGGNGDNEITDQDAIFSQLKLWQDKNHNGVSEDCEMFTLPELGVAKIDLDYRSSNRTDRYGNQFRFKSKVEGPNSAQLGRWAWDVYLLQGN
jgi:hypothetical protein